MRLGSISLGFCALLILAVGTLGTQAANAAPAWKFDGTTLTGTETVAAAAVDDQLKILSTAPGATVECAHTAFAMEIANESGTGVAHVEDFLAEGCSAGSACRVEQFQAKKLPWAGHLLTVKGHGYLVLEKIKFEVLFGGSECSLAGTTMVIKGSAAGLIENATGEIVFNGASAAAAGTSLKDGETAVEWDALFVTEAFGAHKGETLEG